MPLLRPVHYGLPARVAAGAGQLAPRSGPFGEIVHAGRCFAQPTPLEALHQRDCLDSPPQSRGIEAVQMERFFEL